jgi:hypothetical protein
MTAVTFTTPVKVSTSGFAIYTTGRITTAKPGDWVYVFAASDDDGGSPISVTTPNDNLPVETVMAWTSPPSQPAVSAGIYRYQVPLLGSFDGTFTLNSVTPRLLRGIAMAVTGSTDVARRIAISPISYDVAATGFATAKMPPVQLNGSGSGLVVGCGIARTDTVATTPTSGVSGMSYLSHSPSTGVSLLPVLWGRIDTVADGVTTPQGLATMSANPYAGRIPGSVIGYQIALPSLDDDAPKPPDGGYDNRVSVDGWAATDGPVPDIDAAGNTWVLQDLQGWFGNVDVRSGAVDRPMADGVIDGPAPFAGRTITVTGTLVSPSRAALQTAFDTLAGVLASDVRSGVFQVYERVRGVTRQATVRLGGPVLINRLSDVAAAFSLPLFAPDPSRYGATQHSVTWQVYKTSGGRTYDLTFPRSYGPAGNTGQVTVTNLGNRTAWPVFSIVNQYITNPTFRLVGGPSITVLGTLTSADTLVIDSGSRTIKVNDYSRRAQLSSDSQWWGLPPGSSSVLFTCANPGIPPQRATISWRDTYS